MNNLKKITTRPEYDEETYSQLLTSETQADIIIYDNNNYLDTSEIESDLKIVIYDHGPYGDGGWDFLTTVFFQISEIVRGIKDPIAIFITEKALDRAEGEVISLLGKLRSKSKKRNFRLFIAKSKDSFSEFTVNSFLSDKEFENSLTKLNSVFNNIPQGDYVYDRKSKDWLQE